MTPRQPRPRPHSSSPSAEWSIVTSIGRSVASASRASRAASSSRHPPLMRPIGEPSCGTRRRAPGRRYDDPRTVTDRRQRHRDAALAELRGRGEDRVDFAHVPTLASAALAYHPGVNAFLDELATSLPGLRLLTDEGDRESYRRDETVHFEPGLPLAVALPATTGEVADILRIASRHRVPVVPRGAGSGLSGGAAGIEGALTLAMTRMNAIVEIDPRESRRRRVQPGVVNAALKEARRNRGGRLLRAGPGELRVLARRRQHRNTNAGGLLLREVRRHTR